MRGERRERARGERRERRSGGAAERRSGGAAQRRSGAAAQRRSDAQALTTPPSNRSSHSKLRFVFVRVSCEIQRGERASLQLSERLSAVCCLLPAVCCSNATDNGRRDGRPSTGLAPCARRCLIGAVLPALLWTFSLATGWEEKKKKKNRPVYLRLISA